MRPLMKAILCGCALATFGCGGIGSSPDTTSSTATGQVKGKVSLRGKPVSQVEVSFNPSNLNRKNAAVATAKLNADGTYEVTTLVGQNQVALTGPGVAKVPQLSYFTKTIDVQTGMNDLNIEIP